MEDNYPKAYKEVYEILKYVPDEDVLKIPEELIKTIEDNMDVNYNYKVDANIQFEEHPMLRETRAILAVIYRDYWANETQKARIIEKQNYDMQKEEAQKKEKYNCDNLFRNRQEIKEKNTQIVLYKETWYMKFANFVKKFFGRNS